MTEESQNQNGQQEQQDSGANTDDAGRDDGGQQEDVTGLKSALKQERDARKAAERSLRDVQIRLDALEGKDKSDVERLTGERDRLKADLETRESRLREMAVSTALTTAATKAGARYPDLLVERLGKRAELDDDLAVTNAEALIAEAKRQYPDLFRVVEGKADGGKSDEKAGKIKPGIERLQHAYANASTTKTR